MVINTKKLVAILMLSSALWAPAIVQCAAADGSNHGEAEVRAQEEKRGVLTPDEQEELNDKLVESISYDRCTPESFEKIIKRGANVNGNGENSPLGLAAYFGKKEKLELLLHWGADINGVNDKGETALSLAVYRGHADIVTLLLERGACTDAINIVEEVFSNRIAKNILLILTRHMVKDIEIRFQLERRLWDPLGESARAEMWSKAESDKKAREFIQCEQLNAIQQQNGDCGLHAVATAYAIDRCLRTIGSIDDELVLKESQCQAREVIAGYLGSRDTRRDIYNDGTISTERILAAKDRLGMFSCCDLSFASPRKCYTTMQSIEHLNDELPDYSGPIGDNVSIHQMIDDLRGRDRGAVHFICCINTDNFELKRTNHVVLVSIIQEGLRIRMVYADSNNIPLEDNFQARRYVDFIRDMYAVRLLEA